jgi:pseudo-rSAM protein
MFEKDKNYWLYIAPHTYCNIMNTKALLYNTQTGGSIETEDENILSLLRVLHEKKNLGTMALRGEALEQEPYNSFVTEFCNKEMGAVIDRGKIPEKPIQLMPVLNLQRDVDRLQNEQGRYSGEDALRYLLELNIYLHADCTQDCPFCKDFFRQSLCCRKKHNAQPETLDISTLQSILSQIQYGTVGKINLLGGNIMKYPYYKELPSLFAKFKERVRIWNHYANFIDCKTIISDFHYDIPVTFPVNENAWNHCLALLIDTQVQYHFYITGEEEYEKAEIMIEKQKLSNYAIHPVYTKANLAFFEESVYTDHEDIFQTKLSFRQIFAHQKLNTHSFGSLTVLSDGEVYANVNSSVLGNVSCDTFLDIINKEMLTNSAWRKIRDMAPCSDCLYQFLCPSPSNYELVIGKPNLCHVKE